MGDLQHPHIVPVHLLARDRQGRPVLVMKRVEGVAWQRLLDDADHPFWQKGTTRSMDRGDRLLAHLEILMQVCNAVHFAHSRGVVHRDIKPENVMLGDFGELYLLDWGIAVRIGAESAVPGSSSAILGTPAFMAPEMVTTPADVSARTDVFLLGATLHLLLTGRYRHEGDSVEQALFRAFRCQPATYGPEVPPELAAICDRAMALRPADRFASADELRLAIVEYLRRRGSRALARAAEGALGEVEELLRQPRRDDEAQFGRRVQSLLVECRVGFQQALREWPENAEAQKGFSAYLRAAFAYELQLGNLEGARALFDEAGGGDEGMRASLDRLAHEQAALRARERKLQAIERDQDPRIGLGARRAMMGLLLLGASAIALFGLIFRPAQSALRHSDLLLFNAITLGLFAVAALVFRRAISGSALNRRGAGLIAISFVLATGVRLLGWRYDIRPEQILHLELWIYAGLVACGAALFLPALWPSTLPFVVGAILATLAPELTALFFSVAGVVGFVTAISAWQLQRPPPPSA